MILVTGGTGLVGRHLLLALTCNGQSVKAIYRNDSRVAEIKHFFAFAKADAAFQKIQWLIADLTDISQLSVAFKGVTQVYHCAAYISFDPYQLRQLRKTNVEGTANIVNLCISQNVQKLCYVSSIATLAKTPNNPIDEDNFWNPDGSNTVYAITKYGAEMELWRGTQEGLNVIIFNPGIIMGEGDYHTGSGQLFTRLYRGMKYYPSGTSGFVDVKDVVNMLIRGMQSQVVNKRFILVGHNTSYKDVLQLIAQSLNVNVPEKAIPTWLLSIGVLLDKLRGVFTKRRTLTRPTVKALSTKETFSCDALHKAFDFKPAPLASTIERISHHFAAVNQ